MEMLPVISNLPDGYGGVNGPNIVRIRHEGNFRRLLAVQQIEWLSSRMLRITLVGEQLEGFTSLGFDDHVKLVFEPELAGINSTGEKPDMRDFTPRRFNVDARTLVVDFAIHDAGIATAWATSAKVGRKLSVGGPRGSFVIPTDIGCHLLVGDETALPAIGRRLEELTAGTRAIVVAEVDSKAEELILTSNANLQIRWVYRRGASAGDPDAILNALARIALPDRDVFAWAAAESKVARAIRHYLLTERGLDKHWIKAAGYWQRGNVGAHDRITD